MNQSQTISRNEIVGMMVRKVLRSEWDEDSDGYAGCAVFVELNDGTIFELQGVDFGSVEPIRRLNPIGMNLFIADAGVNEQCQGRIVVEVLASEQWPSIGLLLSGGKLLIVSDDCSPRRVGPCVIDENHIYKDGDYVSYWEQGRLP